MAAWWDHLPDRVRDDLMDDPSQHLSDRLARAVADAEDLVTDGEWLAAGGTTQRRLPDRLVAFVRARAAEREAGLAP